MAHAYYYRAMPKKLSVLFTTSTLPADDTDPVPAFVRDEAIAMKALHPELNISILAPHNGHGNTKAYLPRADYDEYRFHYFWPFRLELLTGRGIQPALKKYPWLYVQLPGLFLFETIATIRLVRKLHSDVIYAHWFTPQALTGWAASLITGVPLVFDTQASDAIVLKKVPFAKQLVAAVCRRAIAYTAPSQQTLDKLLYFSSPRNIDMFKSKLTMVPYGTTLPPIDKNAVAQVEQSYALKGKTVFYFIGRLVDRKGVDILIAAFARYHTDHTDSVLIIVGDGQERATYERQAAQSSASNAIIFTGFLTGQVRYTLLARADVCVIPSIHVGDQSEGLPVVFMEALLYGKTTVISDETGAHEVAKNKVNSFIVRAGSVDALYDGLRTATTMTKAEQTRFRKNVTKLAKTFEWTSVAERRYDALIKPFTND